MKNELLGKDEELRMKRNSVCVDLTMSALKQYNRGEGQESAFKVVVLDATKDAYDQGAKELQRVQGLLDEACRHLHKTSTKMLGMPEVGDCYLNSRVIAQDAFGFLLKLKGGE